LPRCLDARASAGVTKKRPAGARRDAERDSVFIKLPSRDGYCG
jgi:hypothetical protein